jgi:hypothetical protein
LVDKFDSGASGITFCCADGDIKQFMVVVCQQPVAVYCKKYF